MTRERPDPALGARAGLLCAQVVVVVALSSNAMAQEAEMHGRIGENLAGDFPPYAYPFFVQTLAGIGGAWYFNPPAYGRHAVPLAIGATTEIGHRPFGAVLATGFSLSTLARADGAWSVVVPGIFAKIDLAYLFASGMWGSTPSNLFPFRLLMGGRVGLALSESYPPSSVTYGSPYMLVRTELEPFLDLEVPISCGSVFKDRRFSAVARGAVDTPVNLSDVFRWSFSVGLNYGWDHDHE